MSRFSVRASMRAALAVFLSALLSVWMTPAAALAAADGADLAVGALVSDDQPAATRDGVPSAYFATVGDRPAWEGGANGEQASADDGRIALSAQDGEVYTSGNWSYELTENGNAAVVAYSGNVETLVIPDMLDGRIVDTVRYDGVFSDDRNAVWGNAKTVKLGKNVTDIGYTTFFNCTNLTSIDFSQSQVSGIGFDAFTNTGITELVLPETLTEFNSEAFDGMYELRDFYFHAGVQPAHSEQPIYAGSDTFQADAYYNPAPRSPHVVYHVPSDSPYYQVIDGVLFSKDGTVLYSRPIGLEGSSYQVPATVRYIADYAFFGSEKLQSVTLNEGLKSIGSSAFANTLLKDVVIPGSVRTIDNWAFYQMPNLERVTFQDGLVDLADKAAMSQFARCPNLKAVRLPETLQRVSDGCFVETGITSIDIPASVTEINYGAFGDNPQLVEVTGCEGLQRIESLAFRRAGISSFPFGESLRYVSGSAFFACPNFANPAYPDYLEKNDAGDYARYDGPVYVSGTEDYASAFEVLDLVNAERAKQDLPALTMDADLLRAAMQRASEVTILFSHDRPTGDGCFSASTKMSGENIASGQWGPSNVMNSWMNSPGHRANILDEDFSIIGIGCFLHDGTRYWVQTFGSGAAEPVDKPANREVEHRVNLMLFQRNIKFGASLPDGVPREGASMQVNVRSEEASAAGIVSPRSFAWKSSDTSVATVDASGVVTFKKKGAVVITATLKGSDLEVSLTIYVAGKDEQVSPWRRSLQLPLGDGLMYRLYNPNSGEHFYTASSAECVSVYAAGWNYEGVGWTAPATSKTPVYRLYNPYAGDHHYTTDVSERDNLVKVGWNDEGIGWYSDDAKGTPLYRQYNPNAVTGTHNYTTDKSENDFLVSVGWRAEGVGWYGL